MNKKQITESRQKKFVKYTFWIALAWTLIIAGMLFRDLAMLKQFTQNLAIREARAHFQTDEAFRFWSATHGGFYIPVDERTPPSPYLAHIFERDIETPSGVQLTLMNPAYALRQMNEDFAEAYGVSGHITSLLPLRSENIPDNWERLALKSFEIGEIEALEFTEFEGEASLRLMQPLITQEGCLKCHAHQEYKVGDIRGGVSVTVPIAAYLQEEQQAATTHSFSYLLVWALGLGLTIQGSAVLKKKDLERVYAHIKLEEAHAQLEVRVKARTNELSQSKQKLESIFRAAPTGIGLVTDRKIQFANDRFSKMLGYTKKELIGQLSRIAYPSDAEFERVGKYKYEQIQEKGTGTIETVLEKKDGTLVNILLSSTPLDLDDLSQGVIFTALDITKRLQAEEKLQESEERFRQLSNLTFEGIMIHNKGVAIDVNDSFTRLFGYSKEGLIGKNIIKLLVLPEYHAIIQENIIKNVAKPYIVTARKKNGVLIPVEIEARDIKGGYRVTAVRDITERIREEEEKRELENHLRQGQKLESIGTLASGVAHEINNPIMGIMSYAQLISQRLEPKQEQLREYAGEIKYETERVAEIVRNLLAFARQEKQTHSLAKMTDIINSTLTLIRTVIKSDQITLSVDIPEDLPQIKCRSQQIQQVLMNLLTNARDALNQRYPEYDPDKIISMRTELFEQESQEWVRIIVEDHGVGIPTKLRERIFDPFYTSKDRALSTGLGLSISLGIVQEHRGELTFESERGKGTCFYLDLPVDNGWEL
ncbi:MAG: PAS domain S-box protein [Anaerolineae bacterium]|jgi:two-component system, cell cycle sensor histidine kinase and response regulator CckA|nr:PAS domain S-box protein [Anaerolineae bacterium]MBT7074028.1 PAS domain S-box protein [Anaerolineae bacterium]MBT7783590.1 PAS domain S-box protein [Anaerolineae bacterium]